VISLASPQVNKKKRKERKERKSKKKKEKKKSSLQKTSKDVQTAGWGNRKSSRNKNKIKVR